MNGFPFSFQEFSLIFKDFLKNSKGSIKFAARKQEKKLSEHCFFFLSVYLYIIKSFTLFSLCSLSTFLVSEIHYLHNHLMAHRQTDCDYIFRALSHSNNYQTASINQCFYCMQSFVDYHKTEANVV